MPLTSASLFEPRQSNVRREWMDRFFSMPTSDESFAIPLPAINTSPSPRVVPSSQTETPEQKVDRYISESNKRYATRQQQGNQELVENKKARESTEDTKNLGRTLATVLGHILSGGDARKTAMVTGPTIAEVSKGEELNKFMERKDAEDHSVALKSFWDNTLKGQDFYKSLETERMKQENAMGIEKERQAGLTARDNATNSKTIQDEKGYFYTQGYNGVTNPLMVGGKHLKGPLPRTGSDDALNYRKSKDAQNEIDEAQTKLQPLQRQYEENDSMIRNLSSSTGDDILSALQKTNSKYAVMSKEETIASLKQAQANLVDDMNYWNKKAGNKPWENYYGKTAKDSNEFSLLKAEYESANEKLAGLEVDDKKPEAQKIIKEQAKREKRLNELSVKLGGQPYSQHYSKYLGESGMPAVKKKFVIIP
jgi:hypothetical protein